VTYDELNWAGAGGPKAAFAGVLNTNVFITLVGCTGVTGDDLVDSD